MSVIKVESYVKGQWLAPPTGGVDIRSALDDSLCAIAGVGYTDYGGMIDYAKSKAGTALRDMTFHDRARLIKALALHLDKHKDELYALSYLTGATLADSKIDIDGGIGTMLVFASKGRREMPDQKIYTDGDLEMLSRKGTFLGQHICVPLQGVGVQINAFNFPVWGMLEKLAPCILAGVPAIIKPATSTCFVAERAFRLMLDSGILPEGSLQLICGSTGDLIDRLDCQDVLSFTGSAATASKLRGHPNIQNGGVRFVAEQDSLNASVLGQDVKADTPEFNLIADEIVREMTAKAGQKCTAIRRVMVPKDQIEPLSANLMKRLGDVKIGDPGHADTDMGSLASNAQKQSVLDAASLLAREAEILCGGNEPEILHAGDTKGAYVTPTLFRCDDPLNAKQVHLTEAFGPVATLMPYDDTTQAAELLNMGRGSLVASVITNDCAFAREITLSSAAYHGRLYFNNRTSANEATGHGSPLPHMIHGGPGRAGGGEELGGIRGVKHYMQRTAIQGSPEIISAITGTWTKGAETKSKKKHPFTRHFQELDIGETLVAGPRNITLEDIETFAHFTGDTFYAHMDDEAANANPFFPGRVAHGYLLLSFAAGLFVEPNPGPVLANTGLEGLSFQKPVSPGDALNVSLTVKRKTKRTADYGEVAWHVTLSNQNNEQVAEYTLLTMNAYQREQNAQTLGDKPT